MAKEIWKNVEVDGANYSIKKFTSMEGLQLVRLILEKIAPIIPALTDDTELMSDEGMLELAKVLGSLTDEDVSGIVKKCLRNVYKVMPAGNQAVMDSAGRYGIEDIEYEPVLTIKLCWEAIQWGCADFFDERGSALMLQAMEHLSLQQSR